MRYTIGDFMFDFNLTDELKVILHKLSKKDKSLYEQLMKKIDEVINRFSNLAKIPKSEGLFKVAVGILLLTATISESVSSRFVIEKIKNKN